MDDLHALPLDGLELGASDGIVTSSLLCEGGDRPEVAEFPDLGIHTRDHRIGAEVSGPRPNSPH